jgi:hypothetical protein
MSRYTKATKIRCNFRRKSRILSVTTHEELARRLRAAYHSGPVAPLRDGLDPTDVDLFVLRIVRSILQAKEPSEKEVPG